MRSVQLVHYIENPLGDFQTEAPQHDGLTDLGRKVVEECNRLGILVDLAHCTDTAVRQALEVSTQPVIWSHSSVTRTRTPNWKMPVWQARQLSFDTAKLIADKGGVVGLWPMRSDVGARPKPTRSGCGSWRVAGRRSRRLRHRHERHFAPGHRAATPTCRRSCAIGRRRAFPRASIQKLAIGNYARVLKQTMSARQA